MKVSCLFLIKFIIIIGFIFSEDIISIDNECPRDKPLFNKSNNECVYEYYNETMHIISNNIIKQ